ncbi:MULTISPECIES: hypothetical protein [unclassified Polaromonas]|uniref:hypothetical protein n=1 Tax=unclassified Polaromonas TaxID=2638319 RepID=UPI000F08F505|nr:MULTISPECIES: hypothetical protein [unclassified Polaromonas]AYQ29519.1 hypothetical protein DT070_16760 [Polaromonas sp. SP1]QGJ19366.1 hypothetical protein F7R28_13835 [Polaromonas sp. Pch-P]
MSQSSSKTGTAAHVGWEKAVVLLAAGLASFVLAAAMQSKWQAGDADLDLAAPPRQRNTPSTSVTPQQVNAVSSLADLTALRLEVAMSNPTLRMNKMVVRDPFGPLAPEFVPPPEVPAPASPPSPLVKTRKSLPPPVAVEPPPPAPPTAPPLPFTAVGAIQGKKIGNGQQQAFIQHGDSLTVIQKGDTVAGSYRVDDITSDRVVFTYLPLGQKQSLLLLDNPR